jgi:hypothetical protein
MTPLADEAAVEASRLAAGRGLIGSCTAASSRLRPMSLWCWAAETVRLPRP